MRALITAMAVLAVVLAGCSQADPGDDDPTADPAAGAAPACMAPCPKAMGTRGAEPWLAIDPTNPDHAVAAAMRQSMGAEPSIPWVVVSMTKDGGTTWQHSELPGGINKGGIYGFFADPMVEFALDGSVVVAGLVAEGGNFYCVETGCLGLPAYARSLDLVVWRSGDGGSTWSQPSPVAEALVGIVAVSEPATGSYRQVYTTEAHDRELLIVDPMSGRMSLFWNGLAADSIRMLSSHSDDSGRTWSEPSPVPGAGYGANAKAFDGHIVLTYKALDQPNTFGVQESRDGGATWSQPKALAPMPNSYWQPAPPVVWGAGNEWSIAVPRADGVDILAANGTEWSVVFSWSGEETHKRDIGYAVDGNGTGIIAYYEGAEAHLMVAPFHNGAAGAPMRIGNTTTPSWLVFEYLGAACVARTCMVVWPAMEPDYTLMSATLRWS